MTEIDQALKDAGLGNDAYWKHKQSGKLIVYHWALEKAAAAKKIAFEQPQIIAADPANKIAVICVTGHLGDKAEWSFGEAAPYNTTQTYPFAMAEKRAKDRVILKLLGLHGEAYSEEEADDFKNGDRGGIQPGTMAPTNGDDPPAGDKRSGDMTVEDLREATKEALADIEGAEGDIERVLQAVTNHIVAIEQTIRRKPMWWYFRDQPDKGMKGRIEAVIKGSPGPEGPTRNLRKLLADLEQQHTHAKAA